MLGMFKAFITLRQQNDQHEAELQNRQTNMDPFVGI